MRKMVMSQPHPNVDEDDHRRTPNPRIHDTSWISPKPNRTHVPSATENSKPTMISINILRHTLVVGGGRKGLCLKGRGIPNLGINLINVMYALKGLNNHGLVKITCSCIKSHMLVKNVDGPIPPRLNMNRTWSFTKKVYLTVINVARCLKRHIFCRIILYITANEHTCVINVARSLPVCPILSDTW